MTPFFRRSAQLQCLTRNCYESTFRQSHALRRPRYLPQSIYAQQRARRYATQQHEDPKPPKNSGDVKNAKDESSKQVAGGQPRNPEDQETKGNGASGNDAENLKFSKLSPEEEKELDRAFEIIKTGLPAGMAKEMDKFKAEIKRDGVPQDVREVMESLKNGGKLDLATVAKLSRMATKFGRQAAERTVNSEREPQQKSGAHDPGPSGTEQKKSSKSQSNTQKQFDLTLDWNTVIISAFVAYLLFRFSVPGENSREITWQEFRTTFLDKGLVEKIVVMNQSRAKVYLHREAVAQMYPDSPASHQNFFYYFTIGSVEAFERKIDESQDELGIPKSERIPVAYSSEISWWATALSFGPTLLLLLPLLWFSRRAASGGGGQSGIFGMGRSRAKRFNHETDIKVKFEDVAGCDEAKQEIMEFVSFLKEPGIYQRLGAKIPRGAILSGPPGTGKTLLAKATAGESGVPFFSVSGSEFVEMFVGVGPSRVRDLFATARKNTPCIIFIDEIDAIGKSRAKQTFGGGSDERESTLNQILTEMDGFNTTEQVVVLAGTNRPDVLDKALMRPGRFDRHINIDRPTMEGRKQIFAVHLRKIVTKENIEYLQGRLAALTPGFSGADIANCVNEAALIAARFHADNVEMKHFEQAIERVIGGLEKKSLVLGPEEKRTVAYHEAGHAICGWYFKYADPLLKVSIIPRGQGALGYAQYLPAGDTYLMNVHQLMDRMAMTLGGRVSEELHFDTITTGASDDFKKVTQMATAMVTKWGMTTKVGYIYFEDDPQSQLHKPFSEETAKNIDSEVRRIVDEAYKQCKDLLIEKKKEVGLVAEELLKKEMLGREDMIRLLGERPFEEKGEFHKYFDIRGAQEEGTPAPGKQEGGDVPHPASDSPTPAPTMFRSDVR